MVKYKERKRLRILGKVLFVCYVLFIIYFLLFSEWYGRTGEMSEYRYNLVLFKEIRRFLTYRETLGTFAVLTNVVGNVVIFCAIRFLYADGKQIPQLFYDGMLQFRTQSLRGSISTTYKSRIFRCGRPSVKYNRRARRLHTVCHMQCNKEKIPCKEVREDEKKDSEN